MAFQKFKEYLEKNGKLQTKPIVSIDGDTGPEPTAKPQKPATKGKGWKTEAAQVNDDNEEPYSAPGKDPGQPKYEKGLLYMGDKKNIYNPKTDDQRLKTDIRKNESAKDYIENFLSNNGQVINNIIDTVELIDDNKDLFEAFVREVKRNGFFENFMQAVLGQPEAFKEIARALSNKDNAQQLAKALMETVSPPEKDDDELEKPRTAKTIKGQPSEDDNIKISRKQMVKAENVVDALASYKSIREIMKSKIG